ncbi:PaaX family transcriptional regulator C-terminal domain-containing protein [Arthrobacter sp. Rue61a]|uniref:PaaX family transcriptional regulator n=1 Tax=Arthrobacter sp. Rue61a TaxID=1118963 RepID=UPI000150AE4C|nr:PaaX family transcriptional regulator C-terminal domain-containing protein [Arthrobacter sp. Rue61a]AFR34525.1 putative transcriptional regulator [Arthrobacter sp. Rue61a]
MAEAATVLDVSPMPRHQHLIVTVYGLYARQQNGTFPVAQLIQLLGDLGVESAGVRSSVSRLKKRGVLVSLRHGGSAAYKLAPELEEVFTAGDERIFARRRARKNDRWLLASFSVPEAQRHLRHKLRTILTRVGCGQVSPGLWIAPGNLASDIEQQLRRAHLLDYVELFKAIHMNEDQLHEKVGEWWDLPSLESLYADFLQRHERALQRWRQWDGEGAESPELLRQAFADYVLMVTEWRRLPYMDPGLPEEYLPDNWHGIGAQELFTELHKLLGPKAQRYASSVIEAN